ncbi:MAG: hypothetical protein V3V40_06350 [Nitrosomonadaceae bacterium]
MKHFGISTLAVLVCIAAGAALADDLSGTLNWDCPPERVGESPFNCETELGTFTVYNYGVFVWSGIETSLPVFIPDTEIHSYTMTTTDKFGQESKPSIIVPVNANPPGQSTFFIFNCTECFKNLTINNPEL